MAKRVITTSAAPKAIGPYSQGIRSENLVFCSGQIGMDPKTAELVPGDVKAQTRRALENLEAVLTEAGAGLSDVVKTTAYLTDMGDFVEFNEAYAEFFGDRPPARATIGVAALPKGGRVEVECVAIT
jgi:2-iminobutanoate/2-iminopropanoate deaminase